MGLFCIEPRTVNNLSQCNQEKLQDKIGECNKSKEKLDATSEVHIEAKNKSKCPLIHCMDWSVFKNFTVIIVVLYTGINGMAFSSHYAYCGPLVQQNGLSEIEGGYLVSISGITDLIGNATFGILFDLQFVKKRSTVFFAIMNGLFSCVIISLPMLKTFEMYSIAFGLWGALATTNTIRNVLLSDNVDRKEQLADAVGMGLLSSAVGYALGPFLTGTLFYLCFLFCDSKKNTRTYTVYS